MSAPYAQLDDEGRQSVVTEIAERLRGAYVVPGLGDRAAARIEQALGSGAYDGLRRTAEFAERLTADLYDVTHDRHLRVSALVTDARPDATRPSMKTFLGEEAPISDSGVVRADRLAGGIGYIEVVSFPPQAFFMAAIDRAMTALADTRAIVVDMRRNSGGDPHAVAYLVSFFVGRRDPVHVMDIVRRRPGSFEFETEQTFTSPTPTSFAGKDCCVLTSRLTFSGGEEFCYDLKALQLGVLVGEPTAGGAHDGADRPLAGGLAIHVPSGMARSPITGGNWEGDGVAPDIAAPASEALRAALQHFGQKVGGDRIDDLSVARLFQVRDAPLPDTEAALYRLIDDHARGQPRLDTMTPEFAMRAQTAAETIRSLIAPLGRVEAATFRGPWAGQGDLFDVRFAGGMQTWGVTLSPDGKVAAAYCGPVQLVSWSAVGSAER